MYERFSKELFKSGAYSCGDSGEDDVYHVVLISGRADQGLTEYRVGVSPDRTELLPMQDVRTLGYDMPSCAQGMLIFHFHWPVLT